MNQLLNASYSPNKGLEKKSLAGNLDAK